MGVAILKKCGEMLYFAGIVAHLLDFLLNYLLIPVYGYYAAGFTTLACYVLFAFAQR